MPSELRFHFVESSSRPLRVKTSESVEQWRKAFASYRADGRATIRDARGRVYHVNLDRCRFVEMVAL